MHLIFIETRPPMNSFLLFRFISAWIGSVYWKSVLNGMKCNAIQKQIENTESQWQYGKMRQLKYALCIFKTGIFDELKSALMLMNSTHTHIKRIEFHFNIASMASFLGSNTFRLKRFSLYNFIPSNSTKRQFLFKSYELRESAAQN